MNLQSQPSCETLRRRIARRLGRVTSSGRNIPELDGIRGWSSLWVFLHHSNGFVTIKSNPPLDPGTFGPLISYLIDDAHMAVRSLEIFFILSGFILAVPFAEQHLGRGPAVRLGAYFWRRLTRIEPPYVVAMTGIFILLVVATKATAAGLFPHLVASVAYVHNIAYGYESVINVVAWSLEIEVQFYLIAPLLGRVFLLDKWRRRALLAAGIIAFPLIQLALGWTKLTLLGQAQFFLAGFFIADFYLHPDDWPRHATRAWDIAFVLGVVALMALPQSLGWPRIVHPIAMMAMVFAAFGGRISRRMLSFPEITTLGAMAYSFYLLHYPLIAIFGRATLGLRFGDDHVTNLLLQLAILFPLAFLATVPFYLTIEQPCMRRDWTRRVAERFGARAALPVPRQTMTPPLERFDSK